MPWYKLGIISKTIKNIINKEGLEEGTDIVKSSIFSIVNGVLFKIVFSIIFTITFIVAISAGGCVGVNVISDKLTHTESNQ